MAPTCMLPPGNPKRGRQKKERLTSFCSYCLTPDGEDVHVEGAGGSAEGEGDGHDGHDHGEGEGEAESEEGEDGGNEQCHFHAGVE